MAWPHQSVEYWLSVGLLANEKKKKFDMRPTRETIDDFVGNMLTTKQQYDQLGSSLTKKGN